MGIESLLHALKLVLEVAFLDLLLSGDNAVVIALACRSLPPRQTRQAMLPGAGVATGFRVLLTLLTSALVQIAVLKLLGGVALTVITIQLTLDGADPGAPGGTVVQRRTDPSLLSVAGTIVVAGLVMSIDNVLALAAVGNGSWVVLVLGLLLCVPLLLSTVPRPAPRAGRRKWSAWVSSPSRLCMARPLTACPCPMNWRASIARRGTFACTTRRGGKEFA